MVALPRWPTFEFVNSCGERWRLEINPEAGCGYLTGDELGWEDEEAVVIDGHEVLGTLEDGPFYFADEERTWLSATWKEVTGHELYLPFQGMIDILQQLNALYGSRDES